MAARKSTKPCDLAKETAHIIRVLHQWGIHSLGQLAALDKQELTARLGPVAAQLWERANGNTTRLLKRVVPVENFQETFEFEHEVETAEPLLFMLRRFLQQLSVRLGTVHLVARQLTLQITFSDKNSYAHTFTIPEPTTNVETLFRMLQTHLESFTSDAPITAISLRAEPGKPGEQQFGLFETALRNPAQLAETLGRLAALFGPARVGTPVLEDTHRPDAFRMEPFSWHLREEAAPAEKRELPATALRRFRRVSAAVMLVDANKPAHLRSAEISGRIVAQKGPYASSGDWWDEGAWRRAEWDVQLENGAVCRVHQDGAEWRLDGIYD